MSSIMALLGSIVDYLKNLSGLGTMGMLSATITLLISLWKSSFLQPYWAAMPEWMKRWMGPVLGMVSAVLALGPLSWATVMAGLSSGMLAAALHDLLDTLKVVPGLSPIYIAIINTIESFLGSPAEAKSVKGQMHSKAA